MSIKLPHFKSPYPLPLNHISHTSSRIDIASVSMRLTLLAACLTLAICTQASAFECGPAEPNRLAIPTQSSSDRKTVIEIRTSPAIYLPGPTFKVEVNSVKPVTPRVLEFMQQTIEQTLLKNEPRLRTARTAADTLIVCTIADLTVSPGVETRIRQEYQKTGERVHTDPTTGMTTRTEDLYSWVDVPYRAMVFDGRMTLKCDVTHSSTGIVLYSDRLIAVYTDARDVATLPGAQSVDDLNAIYLKLADKAVSLILEKLSPRVYSEIVALPEGRLKEAGKLMESGLWSEALALLSSTPGHRNPKEDAYRFYSIGLAHEALAYKAADPREKKRELEQAVENYQRAVEIKPTEDPFWNPRNRAEFVLWQTNGLLAQIEAFEEANRLGAKTLITPDRTAIAATDPRVLTNESIVRLARAGRSSDYITASIEHATETRFDLSEVEVLRLRREGVNKSVLKAMEKSQRGAVYAPNMRLWKTVAIMTASVIWWVPFLLAR